MNIQNFLKMESKNGRFYFFDALSNRIYEVASHEDLKEIQFSDLGLESDVREQALLKNNIYEEVNKNAKTLILEVTEDCNIRCTYCIYDEANSSERNHREKLMSKDIAFKALDDFYKRTDGAEAYLVFYGGEPLINFRLIKELVGYANSISNGGIKFSLTTNGVSLDESKFQFFVENEFKLTVSLDGPEFIHDLNRKTKNGKGTFDIVESNLRSFMEYDEKYYFSNIDFNCTITNHLDIPAINEFFLSTDLFADGKVRFASEISKSTAIDKEISASIDINELKSVLKNSGKIISKSIKASELNGNLVQDSYFGDIVRKIMYRELDENASKGKKICIPYSNRTYVRSGGQVQFCERVQFYGVVDDLSNLDKYSEKFYHEFLEFKRGSCSRCFAYNFCEMCPASFIENSKFSERLSQEKCTEFRRSVEDSMRIYIEGMEDDI